MLSKHARPPPPFLVWCESTPPRKSGLEAAEGVGWGTGHRGPLFTHPGCGRGPFLLLSFGFGVGLTTTHPWGTKRRRVQAQEEEREEEEEAEDP